MNEKMFRRFFVYFCAFIGAGFFGDEIYQFLHAFDRWPSEFTWIIIAALVVAALLTWRGRGDDASEEPQ
jgi:Na+/H+ antiporter NhaC